MSRALPGHHLHNQDPPEDDVLLLQPDRALSADRLHGGAGLHAAPGLRGEAQPRYDDDDDDDDVCWTQTALCDLLGVTILLSLTIFLNTVSSIIPITSDSPLVGKEINVKSEQTISVIMSRDLF